MKKKDYLKPDMVSIEMKVCQQIMAGSPSVSTGMDITLEEEDWDAVPSRMLGDEFGLLN
jgi:hypothetical protein